MTLRIKPANFADRFYPGSRKALEKALASFEEDAAEGRMRVPGEIVGIVVPHAGYVYSGSTAAQSFHAARNTDPETVVALGLSHRTRIEGVSILDAEGCETPLGSIPCDREFQELLSKKILFAGFDIEAHLSEHSVETQLPFVKRTFPEARVVEILTQDDESPLPETVGKAIFEVARKLDRRILVVASTDLSHYPTMEVAERVDHEALEWILSLNLHKAQHEIRRLEQKGLPGVHCAVCSKAAVFSGMATAIHLGADGASLLGYTNSGRGPHGDPHRVVGYGAVAWTKG
ncbi:MAG: AmmeMemoRadiSam system protein B [Candidatus Omnitrophica bacterium]|nr:AmmeMemoRadiSam system protein B [Candidatus Omnitrophota bacterium]